MSRLSLILLLVFIVSLAYAQRPIIVLTFTAVNNTTYVQLDSVKVMNRTQGGENMIYWPDTTLSFENTPGDLLLYIGYTEDQVGVHEIGQQEESFHLFESYPNPVYDQSNISMYIPERSTVDLTVTDVQGRVLISTDRKLDQGTHSFRFIPGDGNFFVFTARWNGISRSVKIITTVQHSKQRCKLESIGGNTDGSVLKTSSQASNGIIQESGILDSPEESRTYTFQFATNIPCPGTPTVEYEGLVYNTIQIFSQCWMKENLNVGEMINGTMDQSDNGSIEKYCYNNEPDSCTKYGGLYQWWEMMQYTTQQGVQGICPPGWHLPTDEEWKVLEGIMDSQYGIGNEVWDIFDNYRGFDAGTNIKTTSGWNYGGNGPDRYGFSGLPGGGFVFIEPFFEFDGIGNAGAWWTSSEYQTYNGHLRIIRYDYPGVNRKAYFKEGGFSVRCLRDE